MSDDPSKFASRGYLLRPGLLEDDLVGRIVDRFVSLERSPDEALPLRMVRSWTPVLRELRFLNLLECGEEFFAPLDHPELLRLADLFVPRPHRVIEVSGHSRRRGPGLPLHSIAQANYRETSRGPRTCMLKVAIALSDIGTEDGGMVVFEGSHRQEEGFPYDLLHPDWDAGGIDADVEREFRESMQGRESLRWEDIPGYRELCFRAGDAVVFTDDLWHGARESRSDRIRRMLCFTYAPYHFANLHGVEYSDEVLERASELQRALLSGPFHGARYEAIDTGRVPDELGFPRLRESDVPTDFGGPIDPPESPHRL